MTEYNCDCGATFTSEREFYRHLKNDECNWRNGTQVTTSPMELETTEEEERLFAAQRDRVAEEESEINDTGWAEDESTLDFYHNRGGNSR